MWLRKTSGNKNIKLKPQFYPNPDYCILRVTGQVTRDMILTLTSPENKTKLINNLLNVMGIKKVIPEPYEVTIEKENPFGWQDILPDAEKIVSNHLLNI